MKISPAPTPPRLLRSLSASSLAATMMVCAAVVALLSISALVTSQFGRYAGRQSGDSDEMAACDAALDYAYTQWKTYTNSYMHNGIVKGPGALTSSNSSKAPASNWIYPANESPLGTGSPGTPGSPNPMAVSFNNNYGSTYSQSGATCFNLQVMSTDQNGQPSSYNSDGTPIFTHTTTASAPVPTSNVPGYPGWAGQTWYYVAVAGVTASNHFGNPHPVAACRYFQVTEVPLFQAAIFYENKLELHPGATMIIAGLVHSNADIWARGFAPLQFKQGNVSYLGSFNQTADINVLYGWDGGNKGWLPGLNNQPNMSKASGLQQIDLSSYYPVTWSDGNSYSSTNGTVGTGQLSKVTTAIDPFGGASTNNNGLHDMVEVPTNNTSDQIAYNNASIRVAINDMVSPPNTTVGGVTTVNPAYLTITDGSGNNLYATNNSLYNAIAAAVGNGASQNFQDLREQATVTATTVDMGKLATATNNVNTMLYIHYTPRAGNVASPALAPNVRRAIRLTNGGTLTQDVTVATDNGMYIQGDYNTGSSSTVNTPSNSSATGSNTVSGYNWRAAAVMADAVTILSNNWNDNNAGNTSLSARKATPTTVNCAILAGDVTSNSASDPGYGNGGAHNFPRFLEDWGNINFTYYGSLVEAFHSETFTGRWQTGSVYNWPNRLWNFDSNLVNKRWPPGVPSGLQFTRGRWQRTVINSNT